MPYSFLVGMLGGTLPPRPGGSSDYREAAMSIRPVQRVSTAQNHIEGAGVRLRRAFGFGKTSDFDPFLLFDDFRGDTPDDYRAGFPWHPHRGIETITYVLAGEVAHGDSLGNEGVIRPGDVQWMTAGSGIVHQEMPAGDEAGRMHGFQLWANLPRSLKMTPPRYQDIAADDVTQVIDDDGTVARIICGELWGKRGPVDGIAADPSYVDISVPPGSRKRIPVETTRHAFAYVFAGSGRFLGASDPMGAPTEWVDPEQGLMLEGEATRPPARAAAGESVDNRTLVLFDRGDEVVVESGDEGIRFLLVSGRPLQEPVAWHGPIVMNTRAELAQAYRELQEGTFLQQEPSGD